MKKNMIPALAVGVLLSSLPSFGKILYVSNTVGNDDYDGLAAVYDGTHGPKFKIQSAIDAADNGDTVIVAPGIYGDEQGAVPASTAGQTVRVYVDKSITLKSSGGRERTAIIGKRSDDTEQGWGSGAVSGIRIASTVATGVDNPVEIEGFTFRDCCTDNTGKIGGVIGWNASSGPVLRNGNGPWVVDCAISNCSYQANGALGRVNAARVRGLNNYSDHAGVNAYQCNLVFCAFTGSKGQVGISGDNTQYAINCTFVNGSHNPCSSSCKMNFLNTVISAHNNATIQSTACTNCVFCAMPSSGDYSDTSNLIGASYIHSQIASPLFGDFRPLEKDDRICSSASCCWRGDVKWLNLVPEKYRFVDMEGTAFVANESGKIHVGAVQTSMNPVAGFAVGNTQNLPYTYVDGLRGASDEKASYYGTYTFLDESQWPHCYEITASLPDGKHLWGFQIGSDYKSDIRFPTKDGRILFVPRISAFEIVRVVFADRDFYVDAANGDDDEYDGRSSLENGATGPFETIQKAVDAVQSLADASSGQFNAVIYVAPGTYNKGETEFSTGVLPKCRVAVKKSNCRVRIVSTGSAEKTIIMGSADETSDSDWVDSCGNGPNAVRCVRFQSAAVGCLQGFTLTGGHTDSTKHTSTVSWRGGGAFISETKNCWLLDCIVSNNCSAASGAAMYGGTAVRCRFMDNHTGNGCSCFFNNVRLVGCVLTSDESSDQNIMRDCTDAIHCSSYSKGKSKIFPTGVHSNLFNNIVVNNTEFGGNALSACASGNVMDGTVYVDKGINVNGAAYITGNAYYVDAPNGDLRIASGSDAIGSGTAWTDLATGERLAADIAWEKYYSILHHDFDGNGLFFTDGNPTAGAYQKPAKYLVLAPVNRPGDVTVSVSATNMLDFGGSLTVTASDEKRKVMGLEVNGVFSDASSFTVRAPDSVSGGMTTVKVVANTNWYVDAVNGVDSNRGWTEDVPVRTLAEAMEKVESGDVVVALPGTYSDGSMIQSAAVIGGSAAPSLRSRVVVPSGVSLVSRYGAEQTIIKGEHADTSTRHGEGAMRCVYLEKGARLAGFTVTGGATHSIGSNSVTDDNSGAGIFCAEAPMANVGYSYPITFVTDCIVSNNVSQAGGGGAYRGCMVLRCRFFDNGSCKEGGALADCCVYDSIFDRNYGMYGMSQPRDVRGCTFGAQSRNWSRTGPQCALRSDPNSAVWPIYNCLFLGGAKCPVKHVYNCIAPSEDFIYSDKSGSDNHHNIIIAQVETDALYVPAFDSAAANAANMEYVKDFELDGDVYGNPRRSNGGMDIGAVETDWRPRYAAMLGGKISVSEVSWEVVDTSTPGVMLHEGNSMAIEWPFGTSLRRARGVVKFCVAEGAVLKVVRNGSQVASFGSGLGEMRIAGVSEMERLMFLAEGGSVEILGFNRQTPFAFIVR